MPPPFIAWLRSPSPQQIGRVKALLFVVCLIPVSLLAWRFWHDDLGANPIEYITRATGEWTLRFLLITLTVTPFRRFTNLNWVLRLRRMLGLYAFFYCCLHLTTYLWLDQFFDWRSIFADIMKRPFITIGFAAFVGMLPLAITSTNAMIKRLGGKRWLWLHRLVYPVAVAGVIHFWWLVKRDIREPLLYAVILGLLLGARRVRTRQTA
ncbi:protein-methionine-sulfoxide reductase heme-binding subunit MsrQ [Viridibacterium curvum]|uniref:Protein-methionine-sulfoxide reductase heme-binding subunit MsrQ n=1 Tax=Viridibacterium curvum TaxID=1101404 RepID=A0ABP9QFS3_9RHOO